MVSPPSGDALLAPHDPMPLLAHRPFALPRRPWVMVQRWHDVTFLHWELAPSVLRPLVPAGLELDLFDGRAWLAVTPLRMSGVRLRWLPPVPTASSFPEINVRTYVRAAGRPGVWFFSLDASSALAVAVAKACFGLPYFRARMRVERGGGGILYASERLGGRAALDFRCAPRGAPRRDGKTLLEAFLTERYCLFTRTRRGLRVTHVHHAPWPLQDADAAIERNTMAPAGISLVGAPAFAHYAPFVDVRVWAPASIQ
jgi:uncharacterized protein YqjF (DUF2071 family)